MFADKLWDEDKNDTISSWKDKKGGCHGKGKGKHHGWSDSEDQDFEDDKKGHLGFCPVLGTVYIIMVFHFVRLYQYQKALSDEEFLERASVQFNSDFESRSSTSAQHFYSNMMGPEPQRRQCQDVLSRQMAPAPQQVMQYVAPPMPEPVSFARNERQED